MQDVTAFIIAGGKSSRMGQDKALMPLNGKVLINYAIAQARAVAEDTFIVGPKEKFGAFGRVLADVYTDCGPLGGVHAGLNRTKTLLSITLPIDAPFVTFAFLRYLVGEAKNSKAMVTVPMTSDGLQPLYAVYRREFLPIAEAALKAGKYKLGDTFPSDSTQYIDLGAPSLKAQFDSAMFDNINSPEDYERAEKRVSQQARSAKSS